MFSPDAKRWFVGAGCFVLVAALAVTAWVGVPGSSGAQGDGTSALTGLGGSDRVPGGRGDGTGAGEQEDIQKEAQRSVLDPRGMDPYAPPEFTHRHSLGPGDGEIPSRSQAMGFSARYSSFTARGSDAMDRLADQGRFSGAGTVDDPYVLERFYVDGDLVIESTDRALVVREGYVAGQLKLNYAGGDLLVHHVYAKDLRVNENIRRAGPDTAGLFHDNEFGFIGQLRHFSGEFRDNTVGPKPDGVATTYLSDTGVADIPEGLVFNFDGFLGANVHSNEIHGLVEIKLHGHYHADCLTCTPHDHHDKTDFPPEEREADDEGSAGQTGEGNGDGDGDGDEAGDDDGDDHGHGGAGEHDHGASQQKLLEEKGLRSHHSIRYHSLHFHDNTIKVKDGQIALRFNDRNHRGDDVTANSEPNPYLEDPHVHYTYAWLEGNTLVGGRLMVDVFNAEDELHPMDHTGVVRLEGNHVTIRVSSDDERHAPAHGLRLTQAEGVEMLVIGNTVVFETEDDGLPMQTLRDSLWEGPERIGIIATVFDRGNVSFVGNTVQEGDVGLFANAFTDTLWWTLADNAFPEEAVRSSNTANEPNERPPEDEEEGGS